jgi:NADPH:quinone reductase-like Zn-dependent oxidoreductase
MTTLLISLLALLQPATAPSKMSAVRISEFGGPDVLRVLQVDRPVPGAGEMLVRVHAAGVNSVDTSIRAGRMAGMAGAGLPYTPGFDVSGVVEQVGPDVARFKAGDAVFSMIDLRRGGGYAEYAIVKETEAAAKPGRITHVQAAGLPLVSLTAWQALFETAGLDKGQTVLIHGGAGGVGSIAVQLAKWKGATVIATASEPNHAFLREIGADQVIDYTTTHFEDVVKDVDVVLDTVGGETRQRSFAVLRAGGFLVSLLGAPSQDLARQHKVRAAGILVHPDAQQLSEIAQLVQLGHLRPIVTHVLPLDQAPAAHEQSETRHTRGKIVLQIVQDQIGD